MTTKEEKARRRHLTRKLGLHDENPGAPKKNDSNEPRRGSPYADSYVCFPCKRSYKQTTEPERARKCPQCAEPIVKMGRAFRPPKKSDIEQWKKVKKLRDAGYLFYMNTYDSAAYPDRLRDVDAFIKANPRHPFRIRALWTN